MFIPSVTVRAHVDYFFTRVYKCEMRNEMLMFSNSSSTELACEDRVLGGGVYTFVVIIENTFFGKISSTELATESFCGNFLLPRHCACHQGGGRSVCGVRLTNEWSG